MPDTGNESDAESHSLYNFDRVAAEYEATRYLPPVITARLAELIVNGLDVDEWLLDAGVGTGRIGRSLTFLHRRTVGIDISPAMMTRFRTILPANASIPDLALADLRALPFPNGTFRRILTVHVLHLIAEWRLALAELWRVLQPGGMLIIGVEDRSYSEIRSYFLDAARTRGLISAAPSGAHSTQAAGLLRSWTPDVTERRSESLRWSHQATGAETLDMLARKTYSSLWSIPDDALAALVEETRTWALKYFQRDNLEDITETFDSQVVLFIARKR